MITVSEYERGGNCDCDCLFDLTLRIKELPAGEYTFHFEEPLRGSDDAPLHFTVDLASEPEGETCVPRTRYPWGI